MCETIQVIKRSIKMRCGRELGGKGLRSLGAARSMHHLVAERLFFLLVAWARDHVATESQQRS